MKNPISLLAAAAVAVTAIPAAMAIPQAANAQSVVVSTPAGGFFWNGRHYRNRVWRGNAWAYYDPIEVAPAYGYDYAPNDYDDSYAPAPTYGYDYAPPPAVGVYYDGGRRYGHRSYDCFRNRYGERTCKYRYW